MWRMFQKSEGFEELFRWVSVWLEMLVYRKGRSDCLLLFPILELPIPSPNTLKSQRFFLSLNVLLFPSLSLPRFLMVLHLILLLVKSLVLLLSLLQPLNMSSPTIFYSEYWFHSHHHCGGGLLPLWHSSYSLRKALFSRLYISVLLSCLYKSWDSSSAWWLP